MESKNFVSNNTTADLDQSWHIPRPTLDRSSKSSQGSTSSNNSTQSARSGSMLLTEANRTQIHTAYEIDKDVACKAKEENIKYYLETAGKSNPLFSLSTENLKKPELHCVSVSNSMHFTVDSSATVKRRSFCRKHQLTILVVTMSTLITIGILAAILLMEMRARRAQY